jgi:3-deoxy-manno-octulosonate cytidylyltransferase (CMP-KDO synthetase)
MRQLAVVIIPARYDSKRLPGKLLKDMDGKSVLERTYDGASKARHPFATIIATDSTPELSSHARKFCKYVYETGTNHRCGTTRIASIHNYPGIAKADIVVNVQGDNPDIDPKLIDDLIDVLITDTSIDMATAYTTLPDGQKPVKDSDVRLILDKDGGILDMVRAGTHCHTEGFKKHIGVVAFRKSALIKYYKLSPSERDRKQGNEYLTAVDNGFRIKTIEYKDDVVSINTEEDLVKAAKKKKPVKKKKTVTKKKRTAKTKS